jgi:hypothetical protein
VEILLQQAKLMLLMANVVFREDRWQEASDIYSEAIHLLQIHAPDELTAPTGEDGCTPAIRKLISKLFLNRSVARKNLGLNAAALVDTGRCRQYDPHLYQMQQQPGLNWPAWTITY